MSVRIRRRAPNFALLAQLEAGGSLKASRLSVRIRRSAPQYALVAKLVDAPDLGSGVTTWRFESSREHHLTIEISEYIAKPIETRRSHLNLSTACDERGGNSGAFKGLLAYFLDTTIPSGQSIQLCHACENGKCSNVLHLYWGTAQENRLDSLTSGRNPSIWENTVRKYGLHEAKRLNAQRSTGNAALGGKAGKGKPKSEEHKRRISEALKNNQNAKICR